MAAKAAVMARERRISGQRWRVSLATMRRVCSSAPPFGLPRLLSGISVVVADPLPVARAGDGEEDGAQVHGLDVDAGGRWGRGL